MTILDRIVEAKRKEVEVTKSRRPLAELQAETERAEPPRDFHGAVTERGPGGVPRITRLAPVAQRLGLPVLVEVHTEQNSSAVLDALARRRRVHTFRASTTAT